MSYTIENRWTGGKLYVAKSAKDVREAVEAAVAEGAYLGNANLGGAYLGNANLGDAYLRDAIGLAPERYNDLLILRGWVCA